MECHKHMFQKLHVVKQRKKIVCYAVATAAAIYFIKKETGLKRLLL